MAKFKKRRSKRLREHDDSDEENGNQSKKAPDLKSGRQAGNIHVSVNLDKPGNNLPLEHTKHEEEEKCAPPCEPSKSEVTPAVRTSTYQPGAETNVAEKEVNTEEIKTGYEREMPTKIINDDGSTQAATSNIVRKLASTNVTSLFNKLHPSVNISLARPYDNNSQQVTVKDTSLVLYLPRSSVC